MTSRRITSIRTYQCKKHKTKFTYNLFSDGSQEVLEKKGRSCLSHKLEPLTLEIIKNK